MGFNFDQFFADASKKVEESVNDILKVGVPSIQASAEQWGIDTLKKMQGEHQAEASAAVKEVLAKDPAPGSFGAALSSTVQGTVLQTYGLQIVLAVVGLIALGIVLRSK